MMGSYKPKIGPLRMGGPRALGDFAAIVGIIAVLAVVPFAVTSSYLLSALSMALLFGVITATYDFASIRTGYINLGYTFIMGIAGYVAFLSTSSPQLLALLAAVGGALGGVLMALPGFRLRGPFYAMATLIFPFVLIVIARTMYDVFKGDDGVPVPFWLPVGGPYAYYLVFSFAVVSLLVLYVLIRTRFGTILKSMSEDEILVESNGINTNIIKLVSFVIAGTIAGISTFLYVSLQGVMSTAVIEPIPLLIYMLLACGIYKPGGVVWSFMGGIGLYMFDIYLRGATPELRLAIISAMLIIIYFLIRGRHAAR